MYSHLFSPLDVGGKRLKNRIVMPPLYLGFAGEGGTVSPLLLEHYKEVASGGVSMITVESSTVDHPAGSVSNRTIRVDTDENLNGLTELARAIQDQGALAGIQINHAGRFAATEDPVAPSQVDTFGRFPRELTREEMEDIRDKFVQAAQRAKHAGFDMVELHGGTGYLLAQFLSPHTNQRTDDYGGSLENRMRFPLEVVEAVQSAVRDFPVGYRLMADEWLPQGLKPQESQIFAKALSDAGMAYISVMGGTYESFGLEEIIQKSRNPGYMADLSQEIKKYVQVPVVTAGRISTGQVAENILASGQADLVGLARGLRVDPEWPRKVQEGREEEIIQCDPDCGDTCMQLVMQGKPAYCARWSPEKTKKYKELFR